MRKRLSMARSYLGIPIEVKGERWGVIVLDSRSPNGIRPPEGLPYDTYRVMAKFLEQMLERG
jgi:GAF domain-containing protein